MKKKDTSKYFYHHLDRRKFIKVAGSSAVIAGAPAILTGLTRTANAAKPNVVRMLMTAPTMIPGDWSKFEEETGIKVEHEVMKDDIGLFLNEVLVNDAGDRFDVISALAGSEQELIDGEAIVPVDTAQLPNWGGMKDSIKNIPYFINDLNRPDGSVWGTPLAMNADSFGYHADILGEPAPPEEVSWSLVFDDERTMGKSATGTYVYYFSECATYLKGAGLADIKNPASMTPKEAEVVADFLIERKKAGQFRSWHTTFDDQVQLIKNNEVLAIRCWEPAVKEAQKAGMNNFHYATAKEGYMKWMHGCYIPTQAKDRGTIEASYTLMNWILSGAYASAISPLRGYVSGRPDLGAQYAKQNGLGDDVGIAIAEAEAKIANKFSHEDFWFIAVPEYLEDMQGQMDRVLAS
ncbi:MAG: extracellular solute-binding protein [Paracoccaceae bacterium]|nr:extracellular solute-binding protein [Paracoccaceae bacterium]